MTPTDSDVRTSLRKRRTAVACRSCGERLPRPVLSLGRTPLANALLNEAAPGRPEPTFPLDVCVCDGCSLVQLRRSVPPESLFREYVYFSSFSETMLRHAADLAGRMIRERRLGPNSLVIEAACNDGYLLKNYRAAGVPVLGIEPARNVARVAAEAGVPTREEFFTAVLAERLVAEGNRADLFHAHNVVAHVPDLNGFLRGIRAVLKPDGLAAIEVPYLRDMLEGCEFDTIYHEHLCYFSLTALDRALRRNGLVVTAVERLPIHGGSLRLFASPSGEPDPSVGDLLAHEQAWGVDTPFPYREFADRVGRTREELRALLARLKAAGHRIAAYGASAKGSTLLNTCGLGRETLDFVVDRSPVKQGRYMPGSLLPVYPPEKLLEQMPAFALLLTWNFADEIFRQQAVYQVRGGRFIIPVPSPQVV
jgi:SAM-dependent methyltransferase